MSGWMTSSGGCRGWRRWLVSKRDEEYFAWKQAVYAKIGWSLADFSKRPLVRL